LYDVLKIENLHLEITLLTVHLPVQVREETVLGY